MDTSQNDILDQSGYTEGDTSGAGGDDINSTKNLGADDTNMSTGRSFQDEEEKKSETASSKGGLAAQSHDTASATGT